MPSTHDPFDMNEYTEANMYEKDEAPFARLAAHAIERGWGERTPAMVVDDAIDDATERIKVLGQASPAGAELFAEVCVLAWWLDQGEPVQFEECVVDLARAMLWSSAAARAERDAGVTS